MGFILFGICIIAMLVGVFGAENLNLDIISASDVHGWVYAHRHDARYTHYGAMLSFIDHVRDGTKADKTRSMLVVDSGDMLQGTGLSDATDPPGKYIFAAAQSIPYDLITTGNHDIGDERAVKLIKSSAHDWFRGNYITTNTFMNGTEEPLGSNYYRYTTLNNGLRVLMFGFMYNSTNVYAGVTVVPGEKVIASDRIKAVLNEYIPKTDLIVMANHIATPNNNESNNDNNKILNALSKYFANIKLRRTDGSYYNLPVIQLTGHSHQAKFRKCQYYATTDAKDQCLQIEPGWALKFLVHTKVSFERVTVTAVINGEQKTFETGHMVNHSVSKDSSIEFGVGKLVAHLNANYPELNITEENYETQSGALLRETIDNWVDQLSLIGRIGCSRYEFNRKTGGKVNDSIYGLWLKAAYPSVVFNDELAKKCTQMPLVGKSSLRESLYKGEIVLDDIYTIMPFPNQVVYMPELTADEVVCIDKAVNNRKSQIMYGEAYDPWVGEEDPLYAEQLDSYEAPVRLSELKDGCYDLILTSYDIGRFSVLFREGGACYHLARPGHNYEGADYPTSPIQQMTTDYILKRYITDNMKCLKDGLNVLPHNTEALVNVDKTRGEQRMLLLALSIVVTVLFVITYIFFIVAVIKLEKLSKKSKKAKKTSLSDTVVYAK